MSEVPLQGKGVVLLKTGLLSEIDRTADALS